MRRTASPHPPVAGIPRRPSHLVRPASRAFQTLAHTAQADGGSTGSHVASSANQRPSAGAGTPGPGGGSRCGARCRGAVVWAAWGAGDVWLALLGSWGREGGRHSRRGPVSRAGPPVGPGKRPAAMRLAARRTLAGGAGGAADRGQTAVPPGASASNSPPTLIDAKPPSHSSTS